jgi:hypothetical protein
LFAVRKKAQLLVVGRPVLSVEPWAAPLAESQAE